ncbi:MAG: hypothetical protein FJW20_09230 [Acidimicrobiia bacterium]|nr:hypothetical protein [Acidimicrobiia bacterium]
MIRSFRDRETEKVFRREFSRKLQSVAAVAKRKLDRVRAAAALADLGAAPGNRLEPLAGDRKGQHNIRVNDQWRICFRWTGTDASDVEIVDYHERVKDGIKEKDNGSGASRRDAAGGVPETAGNYRQPAGD